MVYYHSSLKSDNFFMETRQETLLFRVIENYIKTAEPVGSKFLSSLKGFDWSEATIRNELRALEESGFLTHPHTSAGRIPTTNGYKYYLEKTDVSSVNPGASEINELENAVKGASDEVHELKMLAKTLVDLTNETVLVAFSPDSVYYTGLANLFLKPDFKEMSLVASLSAVFDRCEEVIPTFYTRVSAEPRYYLGKEHPFGEMISILSVRFGKDKNSMLILLGPQRMDYKHNWGLFTKAIELI